MTGRRTRRVLLGEAATLSVAAGALGPVPAALAARPKPRPKKLRWANEARQVRKVYLEAWRAYKRFAFGADHLLPVSGRSAPFFTPRQSVGLSIVEAIDTLWLMELDREVEVARRWLVESFDPVIDADVSVFETTIRLVGGLLAAHHVTRDPALLKRAAELGDRLLPAFRSPTGMPYQRVNLRTGAVSGEGLSIGECNHLAEFAELSRLTGRPAYLDAAKRAAGAVVLRRSALGLLPTGIDVETGAPVIADATIDPPVDSFYEALWDGWQLTRDPELRSWYDTLQGGILQHLAVQRPSGQWWFRHANFRTGAETDGRANELSSYYAGLLFQAGKRAEGDRFLASWTAQLERFPLLPLVLDTVSGRVLEPRNELYPEYLDACLHGWLTTGAERYRRLAAAAWKRELRHLRVPGRGMTIALDATTTPVDRGDLTPGYWFSETPKYLWLMFAEPRRFDRRNHLLTTEGKLLRGAVRPKR